MKFLFGRRRRGSWGGWTGTDPPAGAMSADQLAGAPAGAPAASEAPATAAEPPHATEDTPAAAESRNATETPEASEPQESGRDKSPDDAVQRAQLSPERLDQALKRLQTEIPATAQDGSR